MKLIKRLEIRLFTWLFYRINPRVDIWQTSNDMHGLEGIERPWNLDVISLEFGDKFIELMVSAKGKRALKNMDRVA